MQDSASAAIATQPVRRGISRDEMNLAEFPLTVLSTRSNPKIKTLEFQDSIVTKNGQTVRRQWVITGADKFGLPTASDDEVLLGLLKLTVDDGIRNRKVFFTRYELLRVLRWTTEGRSYSRLQNALDRLSGIRIKATNAFYDNESKSHSTKNFGIVDAYEINDGREATIKPSFFIWSEEIFKSFQVGFIKKLDLDFYLELRSAVSKRLYRYLDKHFWYKSQIKINLFTLAHEKVGVSRNYQYASLIRQQLDPALDELIERGFLAKCEYVGKGKNTEIILYAAQGARRCQGQVEELSAHVRRLPPAAAGTTPAGAEELRADLAQRLVARGIKSAQAQRLLCERSADELKRIAKIIEYYDSLLNSGSRLISRSPVGFLYRAVETADRFVLPGDALAGQGEDARNVKASRPAFEQRSGKSDGRYERYLTERKRELNRIRDDAEPTLLRSIHAEVEQALVKLRSHISPGRFEEAVEHGVDEKLGELFVLPKFEEWLQMK